MKQNPLVSIIIPAYNEEKNISSAIKSATSQSLKAIEIIVVDDASTDDTTSIVKHCAEKDPRIKLIGHDVNRGLSWSRLTGIYAAKSPYIMFLDADDSLRHLAAALLYDKAQETGADIVVMGSRRLTLRMRLPLPLFFPKKYFDHPTILPSVLIPAILRKRGLTLSMCDKLYSRDLLLSSKLTPLKSFYGEDMLSNLRIFHTARTLSWVNYTGYNYTTGGGSSFSPTSLWEKDKILYTQCLTTLRELSIDSPENLSALNSGLYNAMLSATARQLCNPFTTRSTIIKWIEAQLQDSPLSAIAPHDMLTDARRDLHNHLPAYLLSALIDASIL